MVGFVLKPISWLKDQTLSYWDSYLALVGVAEENQRLKDELEKARASSILAEENQQELLRLRKLLKIPQLRESPSFAARVIANRFGPHAALHTITTNKGFVEGATVGTPVVTPRGVVGTVLRASPHASVVLLLTDPGFRVSVISQNSRTPCIAMGSGSSNNELNVSYVSQTSGLQVGELILTAGVGGSFPKGIPVGIITSVDQGHDTLFQRVKAKALVSARDLEEVVMIQEDRYGTPPLPPLMGPPEPLLPEFSEAF